jgi:hypothetical protein
MHPADEAEFAEIITAEQGTIFVDGPKWSKPESPIVTDIQDAGNYLVIWNHSETPPLTAKHYREDEREWWYCDNEFLTIQFLRSGFQYSKPFLFEGRIAIGTTTRAKKIIHKPSAASVERRYKNLRKLIRKSYTNGIVIYQNTSLPRSNTNPGKPAADVWVGPHALQWLRQDPENRWVQQFRDALPRGYILDLVSE